MFCAPVRPYGPDMPTLHIEHPITDFATWKAAFDRIMSRTS